MAGGWSLWVAAGLLLMAAELLLPGIFLVWVGAAALGTGLVLAVMPLGLLATAILFILTLAAAIALGLRFRPSSSNGLNTPGAGLVGRTGTLLEGDRARIGDSDWPVRGQGTTAPGAAVRVVAVEGTTLVVRALPPPARAAEPGAASAPSPGPSPS
ncbi:NfeD family protein [Teichococcus vastitatis]|uniref:NfeD family protein n=1 Tax=Teichococcus vastitatis TaxID=2307076 RepID=A0ABS9WCM6_9PROT|nr:NfeD family protein [Pseudoroseomonas vastitatis]MCI0756510.1 NfeD family protein [Pseudoroseomonas vastitatis]